jgi:hypothetical protein
VFLLVALIYERLDCNSVQSGPLPQNLWSLAQSRAVQITSSRQGEEWLCPSADGKGSALPSQLGPVSSSSAPPPMKLSRPGCPQTDDFPFIPVLTAEKPFRAVILRSPDLIGTTKDLRRCPIFQPPRFFAALKTPAPQALWSAAACCRFR